MKLVSLVTPCPNEEARVSKLCDRVRQPMEALAQYRYGRKHTSRRTLTGTLAGV